MELKDIIKKFGRAIFDRPQQEYADNETRDKFLRSLRREKRTQLEEIEKIRLKREIAEFKKQKLRENLFGMGDNILREKRPLIAKKLQEKHKEAWLGKYRI